MAINIVIGDGSARTKSSATSAATQKILLTPQSKPAGFRVFTTATRMGKNAKLLIRSALPASRSICGTTKARMRGSRRKKTSRSNHQHRAPSRGVSHGWRWHVRQHAAGVTNHQPARRRRIAQMRTEQEKFDIIDIADEQGLVLIKVSARRYQVIRYGRDDVGRNLIAGRTLIFRRGCLVCGPASYDDCVAYLAENCVVVPEHLELNRTGKG